MVEARSRGVPRAGKHQGKARTRRVRSGQLARLRDGRRVERRRSAEWGSGDDPGGGRRSRLAAVETCPGGSHRAPTATRSPVPAGDGRPARGISTAPRVEASASSPLRTPARDGCRRSLGSGGNSRKPTWRVDGSANDQGADDRRRRRAARAEPDGETGVERLVRQNPHFRRPTITHTLGCASYTCKGGTRYSRAPGWSIRRRLVDRHGRWDGRAAGAGREPLPDAGYQLRDCCSRRARRRRRGRHSTGAPGKKTWPHRQGRCGHVIRAVGLGRVELPTSRLSGVRSNHLSYRPVQSTRS